VLAELGFEGENIKLEFEGENIKPVCESLIIV
jgi:hypothetical protein